MTKLPACFENLGESGIGTSDCELVEPSDTEASTWSDKLPRPGETWTVFAIDGSGSMYAIVRRTDGSIDEAPIVLLGSEGEVLPLAPDARSFLEARATPKSIGPFDGEWYVDALPADEEQRDEEIARRERYASWVKARLKITSFRDPAEIAAAVAPLKAELDKHIFG